MTARVVLDVSGYPRHANDATAPLWWGAVLVIVTESVVFGTLLASYFYLRMLQPEWPPAGIDAPGPGLAGIATMLLALSLWPMRRAEVSIQAGRIEQFRAHAAAASLLAAGFLALQILQFAHLGFSWTSHSYGAIVWFTVAIFALHVLALIVYTLIITATARRFSTDRYLGVRFARMLWILVVVSSVPVYVALYVMPYLEKQA